MTVGRCVLISGAGPVGSVTALRLLQLGVPVILFDELLETPVVHRAATTHSSTLDLLSKLGIAEEIISQGLIARYFQYRHRSTNEVFAEFDFGRLSDESNHPYAIQLEQHKTVKIAIDAARKYSNFSFYRGCKVTEVINSNNSVEVRTETVDGHIERWKGEYLIGCDGGRSFVRKSQEIEFPGFTWEEKFIIVASFFDYEAAAGYCNRNYLADPELWCSVFKIPGPDGDGMWRNLFPVLTDDAENIVTSDEYLYRLINKCFPFADKLEVVHRNLYGVHQRVAKAFFKGRVILAGDAAHVNNPLGGMGMNSGIHDGLNIAQKIGVLWDSKKLEPSEVLGLYDRQRRITALKYVQAQSIENKKTLQASNKENAKKKYLNLQNTSENPEKHKSFLMNASLINMLRDAESIR